MARKGWRARLGWRLRCWADRIDDAHAPRLMGWSFTFEDGEGIRFREDRRGCRLAYLGYAEYDRAHSESDSERARVERDAEVRAFLAEQGVDYDALIARGTTPRAEGTRG